MLSTSVKGNADRQHHPRVGRKRHVVAGRHLIRRTRECRARHYNCYTMQWDARTIKDVYRSSVVPEQPLHGKSKDSDGSESNGDARHDDEELFHAAFEV